MQWHDRDGEQHLFGHERRQAQPTFRREKCLPTGGRFLGFPFRLHHQHR